MGFGLAVMQDKTSNFKMQAWAMGNNDGHFSAFQDNV